MALGAVFVPSLSSPISNERVRVNPVASQFSLRIAVTDIAIRRLCATDSVDHLTGMLRRAFAELGRQGLNCQCVDQKPDTTRQRITLGECFVAVVKGNIVGTVTLQGADPTSAVDCYRRAWVASIHQLAVDPEHQRASVGRALLRTAELWARGRHYVELALDTPQPATHLHAYYLRRGFRLVDTVHVAGRAYLSSVFSKKILSPGATASAAGPIKVRRIGPIVNESPVGKSSELDPNTAS
jgi:GNAT superfamily N-acetyltransferase